MRMKAGDLYTLEQQLLWSDKTPIDLTNVASVHLVMVADDPTNPVGVIGTCVVDPEDPTQGYVSYLWKEGETDIPGMYKISFRLTYQDGSILTVPNGDYIWMLIIGD